MSRGGRGAFGGGGKNDMGKMGGTALPWDYDPELEGKLSTAPTGNYPHSKPMQPPIAEPPSEEERRIVFHYRELRAKLRNGPFYTVLGANVRVNNQPTYTQRYKRKKNTLPDLSTRKFVKDLFPKELWSIVDPADKSHVRKTLTLSKRSRIERLLAEGDADDEDAPINPDEDEKDDADEEADVNNDEERENVEDPDQFDEDDEDENDDYNAEQYFENGDDDEFGGEPEGGDDEGY
ncbi:DNA-directed RNA polymerase III subunit C31 [Taxawa tesnikishii (nom. ined.)]|nr:DNA-directed RNA polymerase III subunit C31 [Dothideales sp. JES 119]